MADSSTKQILFVSGDAHYADDMRGVLSQLSDHWTPAFVTNARDAFSILTERPLIATVVADPQLWGVAGETFLDEVRCKFPQVTRLCLSLPAGQKTSPATAMQAISRVTEPDKLRSLLDRTHNLHQVITNQSVAAVIGDLDQLPSVPEIYWKLAEAIAKPSTTVSDLAAIIERDPAMGSKVLQLVNSSFFGLSSRVSSIAAAVKYLGFEMLRGLVLSSHAFSALGAHQKIAVSVEKFQRYSLRVARLASRFATDKQAAEEAFTAGIMHDIGELVLAVQCPAQFAQWLDRDETLPSHKLERETFGVTHGEVGAQLLANWGIPFSITECAAFHHQPQRVLGGDVEVLACVHAADALVAILGAGAPEDSLDSAFLERAGLSGRVPRWRSIAEKEALWKARD
jgi:HD-like signal output (HDOD) protein